MFVRWTSPIRPKTIAFRDELRGWLDENLPKFLADWGGDDDQGGGRAVARRGIARSQERRTDWQRRLNEGRWAAINWPKEWGGREATPVQNVIYSEEMARVRAPGIYNANGIWQIGPMIIHWGTEEQKQRWLPGILDGRRALVPGLQRARRPAPTSPTCAPPRSATATSTSSTARRSGSPPRTSRSGACSCSAPIPTAIERGAKHEGITAFIVDMETPGIECRPIRDIAGDEMFNEVFFTDVRIPADCRLGDEGAGLAGRDGHARPRACRHRRARDHDGGRPAGA